MNDSKFYSVLAAVYLAGYLVLVNAKWSLGLLAALFTVLALVDVWRES